MTMNKKTVRTFELNDTDKHVLANAYDLAWFTQRELFRNYEDEWTQDKKAMVEQCNGIMHAISAFARNFVTDEEFAMWGDDLYGLRG